ncbi:MAG: sensor histidine kinase [Oscillospiraceae bacterium]|nr:sensor histidine kinase [Oscillospiraceae bacterium]
MKMAFATLKMRQKIIVVVGISVFLVWVVVVAVAMSGMQKIYDKKIDRIIGQTVEQTSKYVSSELQNILNLVHYSVLDDRMQTALRLDVNNNPAVYAQAQSAIAPILTQLQIQNAFIESTGLVLKGELFLGSNYPISYDTNYLVERAEQSRLVYWADEPILNASTRHLVLPIVVRVPSGDFSSANEAYMLINIDADILFSYIHRLEENLECSLVLHNKNNVIYGDTQLFENRFGKDYITNDTEIAINDWYIACIMERKVLYADRNQAMINIIIISLVVMSMCMLLAVYVAKTIAKPITALRETTQQIEQGNFAVRVNFTARDEIGDLGRSFNAMSQKVQEYISMLEKEKQQVEYMEEQKRKAEMRTLQAQINPHFLYNTLDSLYWYSLSGRKQEIGYIVEHLSAMLRIGLSKGSETILVEKEISHVESYLKIQKIIFSDKFDYTLFYQPEVLRYTVIKILLQPLVENSLNHGLKDMVQGGKIDISVTIQDDYMVFSVTDNGCGFGNVTPKPYREFSGYALKNIQERLRLHYGETARLNIADQEDKKTVVTIYIPLSKM